MATDNDVSRELILKWLDETEFWVSGLYIDDESGYPAVIAVQATGEVCDATVYVYSHLGLDPSYFFKFERVVWLAGTQTVHKYSLIDETQLELEESFPLRDDEDEVDSYDVFDMHARDVAELLCPHLRQLVRFEDADTTWEDATEGDDAFEEEHAALIGRETPDFWS